MKSPKLCVASAKKLVMSAQYTFMSRMCPYLSSKTNHMSLPLLRLTSQLINPRAMTTAKYSYIFKQDSLQQ